MFDQRQAATLLAALLYWKREGWRTDGHEVEIASGRGMFEPLSESEIDALCAMLQEAQDQGGLAFPCEPPLVLSQRETLRLQELIEAPPPRTSKFCSAQQRYLDNRQTCDRSGDDPPKF
jgi:hypothetical protein